MKASLHLPLLLVAALAAPAALAGDVAARDAKPRRARIENRSSAAIVELRLAEPETEDFGPDLLGDETLAAGDSWVYREPGCAEVDLLLVDLAGRACRIDGVHFCTLDRRLRLDDAGLAGCAGFGRPAPR
jgi:hypothetical protein